MRRRRRGGGAAPAEACGVWLDTAELKRGPLRPLSAKLGAPSRIPERKRSPALLAQPRRRQTTMPAFLSPRADEGDKENSRPAPCSPSTDCGDSGAPLAACPVKILALPQLEGAWEEPPGAGQGVQGTPRAWRAPLGPLELQVESQSQSQGPRGAGGGSWSSPGASGSREAEPWGPAGAEDTNPAPGAAPRGVCCSAQSPLRERGQLPAGPCRQLQLFSQDSQGNRVIAHRHKDRASSPRASPSPREPRGLQLELGSQPLFTQDSEGNRVIKHCWGSPARAGGCCSGVLTAGD